MSVGDENFISVLGLSLVGAFIVGKIAHRLHVPKVTGFVFLGLLLGPSVLNLLTQDLQHQLDYLSEIALGLILFNIGGEFHKELIKKIGWKMLKFSLIYCFFIQLIVSVFSLIFIGWSPLSLEHGVFFALMTGATAVVAAPPTTLMVIKEFDSKGQVTDMIIVILAVGTMISMLSSQILIIGAEHLGILTAKVELSIGEHLLGFVWSIFGSLLVGVGLGFGLSYLEQHEKNNSEVLLAVVSAILLGIYLSDLLHLEPLLVSISMGFCLVNISHSGEDVHHHVKGVGLSIYALFFIMAGAHLNVHHLQTVGYFGLLYITARILAIWSSAWLTGFVLKEKEFPTHLVGLGLFSHGGVALGLMSKLNPNENASTHAIVSAITASIFIFEIIGPILLRQILIKAREVKVGKILEDGSTSLSLNPLDLFQNFLVNLGLKKERHFKAEESIQPLILRKIYAIKAQANFDEVVKYIDTHHFPIYPVVNQDLHYEGMIDLAELKNAMFDHFLSRFVVANDLIGSRHYLSQNDSFEIALDKFHHSQMSALPVVGEKDGKLLGIVEQKRLLMAIQNKNSSKKSTEASAPA